MKVRNESSIILEDIVEIIQHSWTYTEPKVVLIQKCLVIKDILAALKLTLNH